MIYIYSIPRRSDFGLSLSLCLSLCLFLSLSLSFSVSLSVFLFFSLSLCLFLYLSISLGFSLSVYFSLCFIPSFSVSLFLSLTSSSCFRHIAPTTPIKYLSLSLYFTFSSTQALFLLTHAHFFFFPLSLKPFLGYGHIVPTTPVGKIVSIFYAVLGVPLFLLYLSNIGKHLYSLSTSLI